MGGFMLDIIASGWLFIVCITPWVLAYFIYKGQ